MKNLIKSFRELKLSTMIITSMVAIVATTVCMIYAKDIPGILDFKVYAVGLSTALVGLAALVIVVLTLYTMLFVKKGTDISSKKDGQ